jgi:hypothetical protein
MDYTCERGAKRNFEPWREAKLAEETDQERLDRLEREEAERDAMAELESKTMDAKTEMAIADALDEIRTRNARVEGAAKGIAARALNTTEVDAQRAREDREDEEVARRAFQKRAMFLVDDIADDLPLAEPETDERDRAAGEGGSGELPKEAVMVPAQPPSFKRTVKKKKDHAAALGIKRKSALV